MKHILRLLLPCLLFTINVYADKVIWKGEVKSDGTPTEAINLMFNEQYKIKASGFVNLGKWVQQGEKLATDACFEFNKETSLEKVASLQNSNQISICEGKYHPDHIYESLPFTAKQTKIHFWIHDTDYDDNSGAFQVEIIQLSK